MKRFEDKNLEDLLNGFSKIRDNLFAGNYIRSSKYVADLGEYFASKIIPGLTLNKSSNAKGYDAIDKDRKKVQIKTRGAWSHNPKPTIYGFKGELIFDYALIVKLNNDFWITDILKLTKKQVMNHRTPSGSIHYNTAKEHGERLY